jgi:hypothetical protein
VTLSPEPLGFFALGLLRQGPAVCKAASTLELRPEQSSVLRCNIETLSCVAFNVNYSLKSSRRA